MAKRKRKKGKGGGQPGVGTPERSTPPEERSRPSDAEPAEAEETEASEPEPEPEEGTEAEPEPEEATEAEPEPEEATEGEPEREARDGRPGRGWLGALAAGEAVPSFLKHVHPKSVLARSLEPVRTLGLGLLSLYMAIILAITGVLLMVYYVPSTAGAYASIQDLHAVVPFGGLVRNVHRWAGHAMVLLVALHMLRTLLTGSYKDGRRSVWTAGVWLLVLTLAFAFTGYLLPWDQLAFWAVSIGGHLAGNVPLVGDAATRALLGGEEVGQATLVRFYALHVGILPLLTTVYVALHLYRLRRAGGLARPRTPAARERRLPAWPHLYERELALLAFALAAVIVAGLLIDAPLGVEPDLANPDNPSKAPWYFLGLQELVSYSSLVGGVLVPALSLLAIYAVPWVDRSTEGAGSWLRPGGGRLAFAAGAVVAAIVFPAALAYHEHAGGRPPAWINPATLLLLATVVVTAAVGLLKRSPRLAVLALAGASSLSVAMLTAVGIWMRGPTWALLLPWGSP